MPLKKRKIAAGSVTIIVLLTLIFAGPAQAFSLSLDFENTEAEQGKKIELTATVDIDSGEALDIEEITLVLNGPEKVECTFDVTGKMNSGVDEECHGINIKKIPYPQIEKGYGYSYGYNYGYGITEDLVYEITIHTQKFEVGKYETALKIAVNGDTFSEPGETIKITEKRKGAVNVGHGYSGCTTSWECSEWGECKNGEQTRTCKKDKACIVLEKKPEEKQSCQEATEEAVSETTEATEVLEETRLEQETKKIPRKSISSISRITGAVASAGENKGIVGFIIGAAVAAGILSFQHYRKVRYRKKFFDYKDYKLY